MQSSASLTIRHIANVCNRCSRSYALAVAISVRLMQSCSLRKNGPEDNNVLIFSYRSILSNPSHKTSATKQEEVALFFIHKSVPLFPYTVLLREDMLSPIVVLCLVSQRN